MHARHGSMVALALAFVLSFCASSEALEMSTNTTTTYHSIAVDGLQIFYREAGPGIRPNHPAAARFSVLMADVCDPHVVACRSLSPHRPDYPGFRNSDAPDPQRFAYTFDHLADCGSSAPVVGKL